MSYSFPVPRTYLCGLIGSGITRSLTPLLHEGEGRAQGVGLVYRILDLDERGGPDSLRRLVTSAVELGFDGLNITFPVKQSVIGMLDDLDDTAATLGAVNTVKITDGKLTGYNTDCTGFARNLTAGLGGIDPGSVTQIGAGGAGSAVAHATLHSGAQRFTIIDADAARARSLRDSLRNRFPDRDIDADGLDGIAVALKESDGVINATPMGMAHHPGTAFDTALLRDDMWVADVVYRPVETELLRTARAIGARTVSGDGMTVGQALDAFEIFTGLTADADRVAAHMSALLAAEMTATLSTQ
ncbi:shikimate dehydrogenase [Gordonia sp. TBRC 11910]|uniref:Shikimate dehydrogenase (NADP(+)) n=1 Tax=Gordonia asplenii TaxID=2725283 RepID=A0A848KXE8_9ACTN|nr:shikimate dehydrogenase [Gordonia asplenii]NMO03009.1 shikimate dehydrogenase [Gordonia asplenii]